MCLVGIYSVPNLGLAGFWPANAFMLGMLVRFPKLHKPTGWIFCAIGFFMADFLTGASLERNIILNGGNLISVAIGNHLMSGLTPQDRSLKGPYSTLSLIRTILVTSLIVGLLGLVANPVLFGDSSLEGFVFWTATEMVNFVTFLPLLLAAPPGIRLDLGVLRRIIGRMEVKSTLPLAALVASSVLASMTGGPGVVTFAVPALMWCALTYNLFAICCISFVFSIWTLFALRTGIIWTGTDLNSRAFLISSRIGVSLIAFTPLVVASVLAARDELLKKLRVLAEYDVMTGLRNRRAFLEAGAQALATSSDQERLWSVMMLDVDHFKSINDRYGHKAGDRVLATFASLLARLVRSQDIVGRMGGEEFAIVLPDCDLDNATLVASRINALLRTTEIALENGETVHVTVSIGIHIQRSPPSLEEVLNKADAALYHAKNRGRDRFELSD